MAEEGNPKLLRETSFWLDLLERVQLPCSKTRGTDVLVYHSNGLLMCRVIHHTLLWVPGQHV